MTDELQTPTAESERTARASGPKWLDRSEYPFESQYADVGAGRMHYVDEGRGRPLLMLHGNPTWSFLYRRFVEGLSDEYRCVAPDLLGFGLSDKPDRFTYRPRDHARTVESLVEELGLEDVTLVVHDWGGPIGMDYAAKHPENVRSFVVMNTAAWPLDDSLRVQAFSRLVGSLPGRYANRRYNVVADRLIPLAFGDRSRLPPGIHRHYRQPLSNPDDREGAWVFVRELVRSTPWLADLWERRARVAGKPALLAWGMRGPLFRTHALGRWQALFPEARTVAFPDAGHFVQEEKGAEMLPEVRRFLQAESD